MRVDKGKVFAGSDYKINENIIIINPTVGQVIENGQSEYFNMIYTLTSIPSDFKSKLWDCGIDYSKTSDFELFAMLTRNMTREDTKIIFKDLDIQKFTWEQSKINGDWILINKELDIIIDQLVYLRIVEYIRTIFNIKPKIENAANEWTKKVLIEDDRMRIKMRKDNPQDSNMLYDLLISMVNTEEFKYNSKEVMDITLYEFLESVSQVQHKKQSCAMLQGGFSGMVDMSKMDKKNLNWLKTDS